MVKQNKTRRRVISGAFSACSQLDFGDFAEVLYGLDGVGEHLLLGGSEVDFDNLLDTLGADDGRDANVELFGTVFTVAVGGTGQQALSSRR